ncbi:disulfide bond formation protein B [uncultured Thiothrix sp.]|uniref:disulfide bond formation protein B n=1 Tax=uncultured Thiothrix sp. TaxID=223185 RepID=UPI002610AA57|nr:disulfide bond formation protein B [uncultured Thiothrix sp.]
MLERLARWNRSAGFWLILIVLCIVLEGAALVYQYAFYYDPCVLCVHIRAWILGILVASLLGLILRTKRVGLIISNLLVLLCSLGFVERSYRTLGTEMGFLDGACSMNPNFPSFLALNKWLPSVFEPLTSCGYTPWVIPQILSMAQTLMVLSVVMALGMLVMLISSLRRPADSFNL